MPYQIKREKGQIVNPAERHLPAVILIDCEDREKAKEAVEKFLSTIRDDSLASGRVELSFIDVDAQNTIQEFQPAIDYSTEQEEGKVFVNLLKRDPAVWIYRLDNPLNLAMKSIENRIDEYNQVGVSYYRPWIMLFSDRKYDFDGENANISDEALKKFKDNQANQRFIFIPVATNTGVEVSGFQRLFQDPEKAFLIDPKKDSFKDVFIWLSQSACVRFSDDAPEIHEFFKEDFGDSDRIPERNSSAGKRMVEHSEKMATYIDAFLELLTQNDYSYEIAEDDLGGVFVDLGGRYSKYDINVSMIGKVVRISSGKKWYIRMNDLDRYCFSEYPLLKSDFELDMGNDKWRITFEHVVFLHADPVVFGEYLLTLIVKFNEEIEAIVTRGHLDKEERICLPPTPSYFTVGL